MGGYGHGQYGGQQMGYGQQQYGGYGQGQQHIGGYGFNQGQYGGQQMGGYGQQQFTDRDQELRNKIDIIYQRYDRDGSGQLE